MNLQGERRIPATVERTWTALNDPQTLKACIAGCESIEATGENQYLVLMAVRIGPVNAKFKGRLQLADIVPLTSYTIQFDGQGGVAGFGKGSAEVRLAPEDDGVATRLAYSATAQVGGKIAQIGSRLVESAAGKIADDFFKAFEARMAAEAAETAAPAAPAATPVDAAPVPAAAPAAAETGAETGAEPPARPETSAPSAAAFTPAAGIATAATAAAGAVPPPGPIPPTPASGNTTWLWIAAVLVILVAIILLVG